MPHGAQSLPVSTLSVTGAAKSRMIGSRNTLQERASLSNDQSTARTIPEDATWGVGIDGDGTYDLPLAPTPIDTSNAPDSNAALWPFFTTDDDWQLDFDIPFMAEHTSESTGGSSTALTELDMTQFNNRPPQDLDSAGGSEDLIEYLSLGEKVSIENAFTA